MGLRLKKRKPVNRAELRQRYTNNETHGVRFYPPILQNIVYDGQPDAKGVWMLTLADGSERVLSETAALVRLGHLPSRKRYVPDEIIRKTDGTGTAESNHEQRNDPLEGE